MDFNCKYIVVGAGFFGAVMAERIANVLNEDVLVLDIRNHIGGNSFSEINQETGIEVHKYGSHIFHTTNKQVWDYVNTFSAFNNYQHKVITNHLGKLYPMPVNRQTINQFFDLNLSEAEVLPFLKSEAEKESNLDLNSFEGKAISQVGRRIYEAFFRGYTLKQWQTDPLLLPASTFNRLPVRTNDNDFYFDDPYQGIPLLGYGEVFKKMLKHPKIHIKLGVDFFDIKQQIPTTSTIIYSGPIDRYFNYEFGELGWRTLDFQQEIISSDSFQGTTVVNYADEAIPYTRIHEFKFYHPERKSQSGKSIIFREFSRRATRLDTPYYPINTAEDKLRFEQYEAKMKGESNVIFGGRLGQYKYFDMHHVIALALKTFESKIIPKSLEPMEKLDLVVVIPVYNEEKIIEKVINDWLYELSKLNIKFELRLYNDGSKDNTKNVLDQVQAKLQNKNLKIIHKLNSGHGPTILEGYKTANSEWIFQTDSDDEFSSRDFSKFWEQRFFYDFLIGSRDGSGRPLSRKIVSFVTKLTVILFYGGCIKDVNIPYRLMRKTFFETYFKLIPPYFFAPNVVISGIASAKEARIFQAPVSFQERSTGEVSIQKWKLFKSALKSFIETISFRINL